MPGFRSGNLPLRIDTRIKMVVRYSPGCFAGSECIFRTRRTPHHTSRMATGTEAAVTTSGAKA